MERTRPPRNPVTLFALIVSVVVWACVVVSGVSTSASAYSYDRCWRLPPRTEVTAVNSLAATIDGSRLQAAEP